MHDKPSLGIVTLCLDPVMKASQCSPLVELDGMMGGCGLSGACSEIKAFVLYFHIQRKLF